MRLKIKWKYFNKQINEYIKEACNLLDVRPELCSHKSYDFILSESNSWINKCYNYLKNSFDVRENAYAEGFYNEKPYSFYLGGIKGQDHFEIKEVLENLSAKKTKLERSLRILSVCDAVIQPELIDLPTRESYSLMDVVDLLMDKLYFLSDNFYYPIHAILRGNGIRIRDYKEFPLLIQKYETEGFIGLINTSSICARLTPRGREIVEKKRRFDFNKKESFREAEERDFDCFGNPDKPEEQYLMEKTGKVEKEKSGIENIKLNLVKKKKMIEFQQ
jgi:hypothetical protein